MSDGAMDREEEARLLRARIVALKSEIMALEPLPWSPDVALAQEHIGDAMLLLAHRVVAISPEPSPEGGEPD